jgi:hypothetical protein
VTVVITDSNGDKTTVTTDSNGNYSVEVPVGPATIEIVESTLPEGAVQTVGSNPSTVNVPDGGTVTEVDGFYFPTDAPTKAPTPVPTSTPTRPPVTAVPTKAPVPPPTGPPTTEECVDIDFDTAADGSTIPPRAYLENEYEEYGLTLSASGGFGTLPRTLDSANPGSEETCGDPDLGAPNEKCSPSGPGTGIGGEPGAPGENCNPLGNVLIIQEPGAECPDDNADGGMIIFDWAETPATVVKEIALLDVDYETKLTVLYMTPNGNMSVKTIVVPQLGDNSYQVVKIDIPNVKQIVLMAERSVAVASLSFCYEKPAEPTSSPVAAPTPGGTEPTLPPVDMSMSMSM